MAKQVKMCEMKLEIAAAVFQMLNPGRVSVRLSPVTGRVRKIVTTVRPETLTYPEGWRYENGRFTNKKLFGRRTYSQVMIHNFITDQAW